MLKDKKLMELKQLQRNNFEYLKPLVKSEIDILENKNHEYDESGGSFKFINELNNIQLFRLINQRQFKILETAYFTRNNPNNVEDWDNNYSFEIKHYMDEDWQTGFSGMDILNLVLDEEPEFHGSLNDAIKFIFDLGMFEVNPPHGNPIEEYEQGSKGYSEACGVWN